MAIYVNCPHTAKKAMGFCRTAVICLTADKLNVRVEQMENDLLRLRRLHAA